MALKLTIPKRLPGLNEIIRWNNQRVPFLSKGKYIVFKYTIKKRELEEYLVKLFVVQTKGEAGKSIKYTRCKIVFHWYEPNRRRDPSNVCAGGRKFILDALVRSGILQNDNWLISDFSDSFFVCRNKPRVDIFISKGG
jgi:hypothetical protein